MPLGLSNALTIAKSGLYINQYLMTVHGQNIANANNPDYSKKEANIEATTPIRNVSPGSVGTGVRVNEVKRVIDQFLEVQVMKNKSEIGNWEVVNKYAKQIERIFNNSSDSSLSKSFDEFWNAWLDLANNPADAATRTTLLQKSENLIDYFHDSYNQLKNIEGSIDEEIKAKATEVNKITKQIADLNKSIFDTEINENNHANDLRDERDKLVKQLAGILDITYVEENNQFNVFLNNGTSLVTGIFHNELIAEGDIDNRNKTSLYWTDGKGSKIKIDDTLKSGELKGLIYLRDNMVEVYQDKINTLANELMKEVNLQHSQGVGLETFSSVTGTVHVDNTSIPLNFENLNNPVKEGNFKIVVFDSNGNPAESYTVSIGDPEASNPTEINSLDEIVSEINSNFTNINATIVNNKLRIEASSGYTFGFADDTSGVVSGLGLNTFFKGDSYSLTKDINIVATGDTANTVDLYNVKYGDRNKLTGHNYTVNIDGSGNITITDNITGDNVTNFETSVIDGKYTITFDGIVMQFDSSSSPNGNTYYIQNATATSVIDSDNFTDHVFRVDFRTGTNNISVFDVTDNLSLSSSEFSVTNIDVDNNGVDDYVAVKIPKFGITATVKIDSYGVLQITPEKIGAKFIENNITNTDYINAAKIQTPAVDDSDATTKLSNVQISNIASLTNKKYTVTANGGGTYTITDEDGNSITPTSQSATSVTFDGITLNFDGSTTSSDVYYVDSAKLIYSEGDNRNALDIAALRDTEVIDDNSVTFTDYLSTFLAKVGYDTSFSNDKLDAVKVTEEGLQKQRDNVSGVSLDEEMIKLIQIQHSYSATAKLLTVVDTLLQNLMAAVR